MAGQPGGGQHVDPDRWDADCEAAFVEALPPVWECCDRAFSSTSLWRELDSASCRKINAFVARGQSQGMVEMTGRDESIIEFQVNLQDAHCMWARPKDPHQRFERRLRKLLRQPKTNKTALKHFYMKYMQPLPPADHPAGPDGIDENLVQLFQDIGIDDPGSDVATLAFSAACKASKMGTLRRREFICGCAALDADNIDDLRAKVPELRANALSGMIREEVYAHTFTSALDVPSKVLSLELAIAFWEVLLPKWELRKDFSDWALQWADTHLKGKMISKDIWTMVRKFATEVPPDLSTYDDNPSWPVMIDEFVDYYRAQKGA